jgi:hypothetical protein
MNMDLESKSTPSGVSENTWMAINSLTNHFENKGRKHEIDFIHHYTS